LEKYRFVDVLVLIWHLVTVDSEDFANTLDG
jgi:hypothetical protein